eukprot:COSAG01_NODE_119_length_25410_cov_1333.312275_34_plen_38_part_00
MFKISNAKPRQFVKRFDEARLVRALPSTVISAADQLK